MCKVLFLLLVLASCSNSHNPSLYSSKVSADNLGPELENSIENFEDKEEGEGEESLDSTESATTLPTLPALPSLPTLPTATTLPTLPTMTTATTTTLEAKEPNLLTILPIQDLSSDEAANLTLSGQCEKEGSRVIISITSTSGFNQVQTIKCDENSWELPVDLSKTFGEVNIKIAQDSQRASSDFTIKASEKVEETSPSNTQSSTDKPGAKLELQKADIKSVNIEDNSAVLDLLFKKNVIIKDFSYSKNDEAPKELDLNDSTFKVEKTVNVTDLEFNNDYTFNFTAEDREGNSIERKVTLHIEENKLVHNDKPKYYQDQFDASQLVVLTRGIEKNKKDEMIVSQNFVTKTLNFVTEKKRNHPRYSQKNYEGTPIGFDYNFEKGDNNMITFAEFDLSEYKKKILHIEAEIKGTLMKEYISNKNYDFFTTIWWKTDSINFSSNNQPLVFSYYDELNKAGILGSTPDIEKGIYKDEEKKADLLFDQFWRSGNVFIKALELNELIDSINESGELKFYYEDDAVLDYLKIKIIMQE